MSASAALYSQVFCLKNYKKKRIFFWSYRILAGDWKKNGSC